MLIYGPIFTLYENCGGGGGMKIIKTLRGILGVGRSALFNKPCYVPGIFLFLTQQKKYDLRQQITDVLISAKIP